MLLRSKGTFPYTPPLYLLSSGRALHTPVAVDEHFPADWFGNVQRWMNNIVWARGKEKMEVIWSAYQSQKAEGIEKSSFFPVRLSITNYWPLVLPIHSYFNTTAPYSMEIYNEVLEKLSSLEPYHVWEGGFINDIIHQVLNSLLFLPLLKSRLMITSWFVFCHFTQSVSHATDGCSTERLCATMVCQFVNYVIHTHVKCLWMNKLK